MKKGLFLLGSLLLTGSTGASVLTQTNTQTRVNIQENTKSLDIVDLTMPWWESTEVEAPNLTQMLNNSVGKYLIESSMTLTAPDGTKVVATSAFDNSGLRSVLRLNSVHINKVKLEVSSKTSYANYVTAYYSYWEPSENREKDGVRVINRFNWGDDDMTPIWTENVKFEFELSF